MIDSSFSVRFYFVRHGETFSNYSGNVLGQSQSNLTPRGIDQALLAGLALDHVPFWKVVTSDLTRARDTTNHIMGHRDDPIHEDPSLREVAKGAREGRAIGITYEQALALHKAEETSRGETIPIPLLESHEQVWDRLQMFLDKTMEEARHADFPPSSVVNVLAVTHSGTIRILLDQLASDSLPWKALKSRGMDTGKMIQNTSVTLIELDAHKATPTQWLVRQCDLPNASHLESLALMPSSHHLQR